MNSDRLAILDILRKNLRGVMVVLTAFGLVASGCGRPNETVRDNRRLLDAILTAVTIRNAEELANDEELLETRHAAGELSAESYAEIHRAIELAQSNDWEGAERELYEYRNRVPFPK